MLSEFCMLKGDLVYPRSGQRDVQTLSGDLVSSALGGSGSQASTGFSYPVASLPTTRGVSVHYRWETEAWVIDAFTATYWTLSAC